MPWRNGGGTTTELVIAPEGAAASGERFLYRVSIADVASDGPFSRFDGYDRHIMLLAGAGMTLDCGAHGRIELAERFEARLFSGDWDVVGRLAAGPVRDLNLIVDRARASAKLEVLVLEARPRSHVFPGARGDVCVVHVIEGTLEGAGAGDTLVAEGSLELHVRGDRARVAIARISERSQP
jgi:environmental stress-induced protein Ves